MWAGPVAAEEVPRPFESRDTARTANVLTASIAYQVPSDLEKSLYLGGGIVYTRDYFVTPRVALGIQVGVRTFPAPPFHLALGYGLSMKHYFGNWGASKSSGVYFRYGLLLQMNVLEGRSGTATGHDTNLAFGYDREAGPVSPVIEVGYHLTQIRAFDQDTLWWPYAEVLAGVRF